MVFYSHTRESRGFSLIETLAVISLLSLLTALAIPNIRAFRVRAYDTAALSDYRNLKTAIYAESSNPENSQSFFFLNQRGPGPLPSPLSVTSLSDKVRLNYALRLDIPGLLSIITIQVGHDRGERYYRLVEINNNRVEQIVDR